MTMALPRRRGRALRILIYIAVAFVLLWIGYWYATSRIVASTIENAAASLAEHGRVVNCVEKGMRGFPLALDLDCAQASFADASADLSAGMSHIRASAPLYWPGSVSANLSGPFVFDAPGLDLSLEASWSSATSNASAGLSGLRRVSADVEGLIVNRDGESERLPFVSLTAKQASLAAEPAGGSAYRFTISADGVEIVQSEKRTFPPFAIDVDVDALDFGRSLGTDPARAFANWLKQGGALNVNRLRIASGNSAAIARGTLTLSPNGTLSGNLRITFLGLDEVPEVAGQIRPGLKKKTAQVVGAIGAFSRPVEEGGQPANEIPVTIRNGAISVGFIPIASLPPLWK
jgi:hypothetical protein